MSTTNNLTSVDINSITTNSSDSTYYTGNPIINSQGPYFTGYSQVVSEDETNGSKFQNLEDKITEDITKKVFDKILKENGLLELLIQNVNEKVIELLGTDAGLEAVKDLLNSTINEKFNALKIEMEDRLSRIKIDIDILRSELNKCNQTWTSSGCNRLPYTIGEISTRLNDLERGRSDILAQLNSFRHEVDYKLGNDGNKEQTV